MENDPLYRQGLQHFGAGEWAEAVACFTQLQVNYPDDPRIAQFLESARLRAAVGTGLERGARVQARAGWLQVVSRLLVIVVILVIAGAVYWAYQTFAVPAQVETARLARLDQLRRTGESQIASAQYAEAAKTYQEVLNEVPDDPEANAGLVRARQLEQLAQLYAQATEALGADNNAEAVRLLEEIDAIDPNYRDVASLLNQIESTQALSEDYAAAVALYDANDLPGAAQAFESIRATDSDFRSNEVREYLFNAYVALGDQQIEQADTIAAVELADGYYEKALSVRPLDPRVETAQRTAATFLEGAGAYQAKEWELVIRELAVVYEQQPAYFGGQVAEWLFEAFITTGDDFMGQGDPFSARDRFAEALRVAPSDAQRAEAQQKYDTANRLTTPTPTARPSPTPLPSGYVAPSYTLRVTGTPDPNPFRLINMTYLPNTITGEGCKWAGVAGRLFDRQGAPLTADTLGVRVTGPLDQGVAAGAHRVIGESGWLVQFDVVSKAIQGWVQVYYKDKPASGLIPFATRNSCFENMLIVDIQQVLPLP